jgi:excisionase family DNA binding protein
VLLTVKEAAAQLAVSISTIERLFDREELTRVKVGRSVRVDADDLRAFVPRHGGGDVQREPVAPRQLSAYHAKCSEIARLSQRDAAAVKAQALAKASEICGKQISSSKQLSYVEMHDLLDWLEALVIACRSGIFASPADPSS